MNVAYHQFDLPQDAVLAGDLAIDTEAMGLDHRRDRMCVLQLSDEKQNVYVVHFPTADYNSPNLIKLLSDSKRAKIFHYARFDVALIQHHFNITLQNIYCTKIASKLSRTYTDKHGLQDICNELLGVKISKQQRSSYWGDKMLTKEQIEYAASDVLHLHALRRKFDEMLVREKRDEVANECFKFIPHRAKLDVIGWQDIDIFAHSS